MLSFARAGVAAAMVGALVAGSGLAASPQPHGYIRIDQAGFAPGESKQAYLMTTAPVSGARFSVVDSYGRAVLSGRVPARSRGAWNDAYRAVYQLDLSRLERPGAYRVKVRGIASPVFRIQDAAALYGRIVRDGVTFYQAQRDGRAVLPGVLHRRPSHLDDAAATVYATPHFVEDDIIGDADLTRIGGPVDVEGGWFDAGDYLKITQTTAYGVITLLAAQRALGRAAPASLAAEARHGTDWLGKMWDERTGTLYLQVGIGSGNEAGTFTGDHDLWRLPEGDDHDTDPANRYATAHRPVFEAAPPGKPISPNLAGRVSAAFALAAQTDPDRRRARAELRAATTLYARADVTSPPDPLVTALPFAFYPEDTWHDDMELGATEIALAARRLGVAGAGAYLRDAMTYARGYLSAETGDTLNLYDVSALAHADLAAVTTDRKGRAQLVADLRRQVRTGADRAAKDVFHAGGVYTDFDADSHTFGLMATEALYRAATGDRTYAAFATQQRDWLLGANAWGTSFMIGEGATYPECPQHQVANLTRGVLTGAVVNGPNDPSLFEDGLGDYQDGMVVCPPGGADPYAAFSGHASRFVDDVRAWQTDEPALDMTGSAVLGAALQSRVARGPAR